MKNPNRQSKPTGKPNPKPQPSSKASSSSSSAAAAAGADPNSHANLGATSTTPSNPNPKPSSNALSAASPQPHQQRHHPLAGAAPPPPRPLLTVAAVQEAMAALPPPPPYGLESLERRAIGLSDGTVRSYFALPLDPPPHHQILPPHFAPGRHLPLPGPFSDQWTEPLPSGLPKRKREDGNDEQRWAGLHANGMLPAEASGRHMEREERRAVKQVKTDGSGATVVQVDEKAIKAAFLKMAKVVNENAAQKKNYQANGKITPLRCIVCPRTPKEFIDLHSLLNHAYNAKSAELRADHLGLHKALCVLMGWNYSVDPANKKSYQNLSPAEAEANKADLILWPPTVILENTYKWKKDGQKDGLSNKEIEVKLKEMGFPGVKVKALYGKDAHRGMALVKFASNQASLKEAERLAVFFEKEGRGREGWTRARDCPAADDSSNPMLIKVDEKTGERTSVLYGYLATACDLDIDFEMMKKATIRSRKEPDLSI